MSLTQVLRITAPALVLATVLAACANDYGQRSRPITLRPQPPAPAADTEPAAQDEAPPGQTMSPQ